MFRAMLCSSSGAHGYSADYKIERPVLGLLLVEVSNPMNPRTGRSML